MMIFEGNKKNVVYWIERLKRMPMIRKRDKAGHSEAEAIVYALSEIERISHECIDNILPHFSKEELSDDQVETVLIDLSTELNNIVYLIHDSRFFSNWVRFKIDDL